MVKWMGKSKKKLGYGDNPPSTTLLVALFVAACGVFTIESFFDDLVDMLTRWPRNVHAWQLHMGAVCVGVVAFAASLFLLVLFETASKETAWQSSWPWIPLAGLTAIASVAPIPFYVFAPIGTLTGVWAYRRTSSARRLSRLP